MAWLGVERIQHLKLFQAVQIERDSDGQRFQAWLQQNAAPSRP